MKRDETTTVLLVEDNPGDARLIEEMLKEVKGRPFHLECVDRLREGIQRLARGGVDIVLLDMSLPDSQGFGTFEKLKTVATDLPIVVMTGLSDETTAIKMVKEGAQDYLVKGQVDANVLSRVIRYAIERQRLLTELRNLSIIDELTGLYNRRGFLALAQQQLKMAERKKIAMVLIYADMDNMKRINDVYGHQEGDNALVEVATVFRKTFRESDIVARIGGDEFVVLAIEVHEENADVLTERLDGALEERNRTAKSGYRFSVSTGVANYDPDAPCSIIELMARADQRMYERKREKEKS